MPAPRVDRTGQAVVVDGCCHGTVVAEYRGPYPSVHVRITDACPSHGHVRRAGVIDHTVAQALSTPPA